MSASKEFELTPVEDIRRLIHVFKKDACITAVKSPSLQRRGVDALYESQFGSKTVQFYVNRYIGLMWDVFAFDNSSEA